MSSIGSQKSAPAVYEPPEQSFIGQIVDSLLILVLVVASLFAPVYFGLTGGGKTNLTFTDKTWAGMGQTPAMQAQWEKLGYTPETGRRHHQPPFRLQLLVGLAGPDGNRGHRLFRVRGPLLGKEYRDVIAERFGETVRRR